VDGSTNGYEGGEHVHLALGCGPRKGAAQADVLHAKWLAAAANHSSRPSMGMS
jgi:hypothetical protein